ncbi:E3 ubiquitin-protein ligase RFWD3-like [Chrysoperla carnea]|uniref:E3 ubiquitin-protein ligase RFWD3-like n=1 Tax=Chrysoperla carnea TaxID=189513 RepID=UPI001D0916C6|nr:E3 ubiquitin-protein ligase RFWD3-like [Chrysoperla carnea]
MDSFTFSLGLFFSSIHLLNLSTLESSTDDSSSQTEGDTPYEEDSNEEEIEVSDTEDMSESSNSEISDSASNFSYESDFRPETLPDTLESSDPSNTEYEDSESYPSSVETLVNNQSEPESDIHNSETVEPSIEEENNDAQQEEVMEDGAPNSPQPEGEENVSFRLKRKRIIGSESPESKRVKSDSDRDEDEGRTCPICFDYWTNSGKHRLCALKCGHLFGKNCVVRWLQSQNRKSCPTCKTKATMNDIRHIFAKTIIATDTVSIDNLKTELESVKSERNRLNQDVSRLNTINRNQQITIQQQATRIYDLENKCTNIDKKDEQNDKLVRITFDKAIELSKDNACRVMAHNYDNLLVVTLKSPNPLFSGFGIRKVETSDYSIKQFVPLHSKLIRDLAFHPQTGEWLLSVSLDKSAKLTNVATNVIINTFQTDMPLWSCCWDANDPNLFYVGGQKVLQFDVRNPSEPSKTFVTPNDPTSVIALASVCSGTGEFLPRGGLICCKLNSCWVFEHLETESVPKKINLEGPFVSLNYNTTYRQILISTRPNPRWVFCRHILCDLVNGDENCFNVKTIHYFQGGTTQTQLSRNCQIELANDVLVLCYQETKKQINVWSVGSGNLIQTLPAPDPIIDMCYVKIRNQLIALTEKRIRIFNIK